MDGKEQNPAHRPRLRRWWRLAEGHARRRGEGRRTPTSPGPPGSRLNEGHARRRGEGLANFGSFDLGKCGQLRAVLG